MSKTKAYNMDCMEYMATLPDKAFQLAIVDPPYMDVFNTQNWKDTCAKQKEYKSDTHILTGNKPEREYFNELKRVSKNQIIWGGNYFTDYLKVSRAWVVWYKSNQDNYFSDAELAWTSFDRVLKVFKWRWSGMLQQNMKNKEIRIHPTQKPVALYEWLLMNYAKEGDKILDTHLGSGSSRIAAHKLGFEFVGCELDKDYFEAQEKRFKTETMQQTLF